ncbi:MAG: hypothetical protein AVDCRST_MAG13-2795, partial [uncultured Solirubrobacteraceae bacterium]
KLRWGSTIRQRVTLEAYRGVSTSLEVLATGLGRPAARKALAAWRASPRRRS